MWSIIHTNHLQDPGLQELRTTRLSPLVILFSVIIGEQSKLDA
jgi:hypothetical protein